MEKNEKLNVVMLAVAGLILVAVNLGVWMASRSGAIPAVGNPVLWGVFVVLNIVSILWAVALMGLQPLAAATAYAVGGLIAFIGVRTMDGVNIAEVTTAGATYGAFGTLAVCNAMVKVRLAFFRKAQVPFVFIIIGLLVLDAVINSRISHADGRAYMNAVVLPLAIGGVGVGLIWAAISRVLSGGRADKAADAEEEVKAAASETKASEKLTLNIPEEKERPAVKKPEPVKVKQPEPAPAPIPKPEPVIAETPKVIPAEDTPPEKIAAEAPEKEESFFPLDIDKDEKYDARPAAFQQVEEEEDDEFVLPTFDSSLYSAGSLDDHRFGGVAVEEPQVAVSVESEQQEEQAKKPEPQPEEEPKTEAEKPKEEAPESKGKNDDWLGGHMDLLNKLK